MADCWPRYLCGDCCNICRHYSLRDRQQSFTISTNVQHRSSNWQWCCNYSATGNAHYDELSNAIIISGTSCVSFQCPDTAPIEAPIISPTGAPVVSPTRRPVVSPIRQPAPLIPEVSPTSSPVAAPTPSSTDRAVAIRDYINSITLSSGPLSYPSQASPQERALQWLIEDDLSTDVSDTLAQRQRFALATMWFANGPFDSAQTSTWLSSRDECSVGEC